jgi:hypothetical protein
MLCSRSKSLSHSSGLLKLAPFEPGPFYSSCLKPVTLQALDRGNLAVGAGRIVAADNTIRKLSMGADRL